jgi:hypothetical protein
MSASEFATTPPANSTSMNTVVSTNTVIKRRRERTRPGVA